MPSHHCRSAGPAARDGSRRVQWRSPCHLSGGIVRVLRSQINQFWRLYRSVSSGTKGRFPSYPVGTTHPIHGAICFTSNLTAVPPIATEDWRHNHTLPKPGVLHSALSHQLVKSFKSRQAPARIELIDTLLVIHTATPQLLHLYRLPRSLPLGMLELLNATH